MLKQQYDMLSAEREGFLWQARLQAELTIPSLLPPDGTSSSYQDLYKPYQSIGAMGVNSLANKLTLALYPGTEPFFKFEAATSAEEFKEMSQEDLDAIDVELSAMEQTIMSHITKRGDRGAITEALKHLLVAGNAAVYVGEESSRVYALDSYVALRDGEGNLLKLITKDVLSYETFKEAHPSRTEIHASHRGQRSYDPKTIEVYTCMYREGGQWKVVEEAAGVTISDTQQTHPIEQPPYLALRFNRIDGQSYGRGYVENLFGDLRSLENLSQAMVEASAINARCVFLVNPSGATSQVLFEKAANGDVIPGIPSDISTARVDKGADLAVTANQIARLEGRLEKSFMMLASVQRDAERVTATEITAMAGELESTLGGAYSVLSEEFQRPYISRLIKVLQRTSQVPEWPEDLLDVAIVTGTAGIGRGIDRERMVQFTQVLVEVLGADTVKTYVNVPVAIARLGASFGLKLSGLMKTQEQLQSEQQQAQEQQLTEKLGPTAIAAAGQLTAEQMKQGGATNGSQEDPSQAQGNPGGPSQAGI